MADHFLRSRRVAEEDQHVAVNIIFVSKCSGEHVRVALTYWRHLRNPRLCKQLSTYWTQPPVETMGSIFKTPM